MPFAIGAIDLAVLAAYLLGVVALGLWVGRGQRDLGAYLLGGRDMPWWAILGSIVATETSTVTFLSVPGLAFAAGGDLRFLQLALGYIVGRAVVVVVLLPAYFRGQLFTAYEVLALRFGRTTRRTASLLFLVARNLGDGLRLFLTAIVLEQAAGISLGAAIALIGGATIIYTVFGGMRSVVWNDCVQLVIYVVGGAVVAAVIVARVPGGAEAILQFAADEGKLRMIDPSWSLGDPYTLWAGLIGGMFLTLGTHGTDQMLVQRYLCARSQRDAGRALVLSGFVVFAQFAMFLLLGVALACYASLFWTDREMPGGDRVLATFIVEDLPRDVGLVGLLLAAVFAAAMSTLSSSLNSSASAAVNDFTSSRNDDGSGDDDPARRLALGRGWTVVFGVVQIGIALAAARVSSSVIVEVLAIAGFTAGLLLGVFALGVLTKRAGQGAAIAGLVAGTAALLLVRFGLPRWDIVVAWPWYPVIGAVVTFGVGWGAGSRAFGRTE